MGALAAYLVGPCSSRLIAPACCRCRVRVRAASGLSLGALVFASRLCWRLHDPLAGNMALGVNQHRIYACRLGGCPR